MDHIRRALVGYFAILYITSCRSGEIDGPLEDNSANYLHHVELLNLQEYYESKIVYLEKELEKKSTECEEQQMRYVQAIEKLQEICTNQRKRAQQGGRSAWPLDDNTFDNRVPNIVSKLDNITQENDAQSRLINQLEIALDNETKQFESMRSELLDAVRWMTDENRHEIEREVGMTIERENEKIAHAVWTKLLRSLDNISRIWERNMTTLQDTWAVKIKTIVEQITQLEMSDLHSSTLSEHIKAEMKALNHSVYVNMHRSHQRQGDMQNVLNSVMNEFRRNVTTMLTSRINQLVNNFATKDSIVKLTEKQQEFSHNQLLALRNINESYNQYLRARFEMIRENMKAMLLNKTKEKDGLYEDLSDEMEIVRNNSIHILSAFQRKQRVMEMQMLELQQHVRSLAPLVGLQHKYRRMEAEVGQCQQNIHHLLQTQEKRYRDMQETVDNLTGDLSRNFSREISQQLEELERKMARKLYNTSESLNKRTRLVEIQSNSSETKLKTLMDISRKVERMAVWHSFNVRLRDGTTSRSGRVEIFVNDEWGTVCDDGWDDNAASVVCRQLGYNGGYARIAAHFGRGRGHVWLDDTKCTGEESALYECRHRSIGSHNCDHVEDAGVACWHADRIRLVNGSSQHNGRVELLHDGIFGTICDDDWGNADATVVCRQLGYKSGIAHGASYFGRGTGPIWLDNVNCAGTEEKLTDCRLTRFGDHNCGHGEDAGVTCLND